LKKGREDIIERFMELQKLMDYGDGPTREKAYPELVKLQKKLGLSGQLVVGNKTYRVRKKSTKKSNIKRKAPVKKKVLTKSKTKRR
jgi:hypothetical protein